MRYRRRKRHSKGFWRIWAVIVVSALVIVLAVRADRAVRPTARMQAQHFAEVCAQNIIEKAAADYLSANELQYCDFAAVLYDENGRAVSVETLPYCINRVQTQLGLTVNERLAETGRISHKIPIGSLTGSYLLAGKGPSLKVRICPEGKADVAIKSDFESAGINQTRHRISAVITAEVTSSLPLYSFDSQVSFEFLLAETVIIGDVPFGG